MSSKTQSQLPQVRPTQFEDTIHDIFNKSVNLFRGDVNFSFDLISLKGRNGLDLKVTACYGSHVKSQVNRSNVTAPTSILGLGWQLPFDRIEVSDHDNASINDNQYYLYQNNTSIELVVTLQPWCRLTLPSSAASTLSQGQLDAAICADFLSAGLNLDPASSIVTVTANQRWQIRDDINQRLFDVQRQNDELLVYPGGLAFESFQYNFSHILYYPAYERWELVKDDGTSYFFGGQQTANSVQWKVKWGNWSGHSALTENDQRQPLQSRYPIIWNLVTVEDVWGDRIHFEYETVEQAVGKGGLAFTKACYLSRITDMLGRTVCFQYAEKEYHINAPAQAREYLSPHWDHPYTEQPDNEPSAYQDRYETRYLDHIEVNNPQQQQLYTIQLSYATAHFSQYHDDDPLYGDTIKRTLTGIQRIFANHCASPGLRFEYAPADAIHPGALCRAITPNGAIIDYQYKKQSIPRCERQFTIDNPWPNTAKPRVWFGSDYVVNLWLNESTDQIQLSLYTWLGRWQAWSEDPLLIQSSFDIQSVNAVTTEDFACVSYTVPQHQKSYVYIYHKDNLRWGEWIQAAPITLNSTNLQVVAGDNFVLICDQSQRQLLRYTWDCFNKIWQIEDVSTEVANGDPNGKLYVTATSKHYAVLDYAPSHGGEHHNQLSLYYQDNQYRWHAGDSQEMVFTIGGDHPEQSFGFYSSASFMVLTYITHEVSLQFNYTVKVISWDEIFSSLDSHDFTYQLPKSAPSKVITIPFIARFVNNSLIASGPNLLRYNGEKWLQNNSLDIRDTCRDTDINWFAYGEDYAILTSNREYAVDARLVAYDATTEIRQWNSQGVVLYSKDGSTSDRKRRYFPTAGADIATMDNRVYHRDSQCNWQNAVAHYQPLPDAIDSTTMINQGPRFIAYLNMQGESAQNSAVYPFENQYLCQETLLDQRFFTYINADGSISSQVNGQYPSGLSTFVTYLPLHKDFDDATHITLNRYLDDTLQGELIDYCVASMQINNGYTTSSTQYLFDINSATCDPTGSIFKYYKTIDYPGTESIDDPCFGYTEHYYFNGLSDPNPSSNLIETEPATALLDGQQIEQKVFNQQGQLLRHEQQQLQSFTQISGNTVHQNLFGGYVRCLKNTVYNEELVVTTHYQYETQFGKLSQEYFENITPEGTTETLYKSYQYAFQAYPWFLYKNIIDVPFSQFDSVLVSGSASSQLTAGSLQQYAPQQRTQNGMPAPTVWASSTAYVLQQQTQLADLDIAHLIQKDPGSYWQQVHQILERTFYGSIVTQSDVSGLTEKIFWDRNQILPIATFSLKDPLSCDFIGFEPYEDTQDRWRMHNTQLKLSDYLRSGDAYTGSCCFQLQPQHTLEKISPVQQNGTLIVSGWIKAPQGFLSDTGDVYLITEAENPQKIAITPTHEDRWEYWHAVIETSQSHSLMLSMAITNTKHSSSLLFNNISTFPLSCNMDAKFYDLIYSDEIAAIRNDAGTLRYAYNPLRQKFAETGPWGNSQKGVVNYAPRSWHDPIPYQYPQSTPSSELAIMAAEGGIYETFTEGDQIWASWQREDPSVWQIQNGQLYHNGSSSDTIRWLTTSTQSHYALGFTLSSPKTEQLSFSIAIGDRLEASWDLQSGWSMALDGTRHSDPTINGKVPTSVLLIPVNGALLLLADGRIVFSLWNTTPLTGSFQLSAKGALQFANFITYQAPQLSLNYKGGTGQILQTQVLNNGTTLAKGTVYDALGHSIAQTKIAGFEHTLFGYRQQLITALDPETGIMSGEISQAYPKDEGYPYHGTQYESAPLGRPVQQGLPGKTFAITPDNPHTTRFDYHVTDQTSIAGITPHNGQFTVSAITDPNGTMIYTLTDRKGQLLGRQTNRGNQVLKAVQQIFNPAGQIIRVLHPNSFNAPTPEQDFITQSQYNFLGQLTARTTTDSGTTQYIYDPTGRIRFSTTAQTNAQGVILYKKYDALGRIIEEGQIAQTWDPEQLQTIADHQPEYPQNNNWDTFNSYDGTGKESTLLGRLWKTQKRNPGAIIIENSYQYDHFGHTTENQLSVSGQSPQRSQYSYDNLGNIIAIDYPVGAPVAKVCYRYNEMGQNIAIGTPSEPDKFAAYTYHADGSLANERLNTQGAQPLERSFTYNSPGWLTELDNHYQDQRPILAQTFHYTDDGYNGAGYFNGNLAQVSHHNAITPAHSFDYRYQYDGSGQLLVAQHSRNPLYSLGTQTPLSFDANGNILDLQQGSQQQHYDYLNQSNRILTVQTDQGISQTFAYDVGGNITGASAHQISDIAYNLLNNLPMTVKTENQEILSLLYNGLNQRVLKRHQDGTQTLYVHGLNDEPLLEQGQQLRQYIYGVGGLSVMILDQQPLYVLKDQQGSVRVVVADDGEIRAMLDYMPFGQLITATALHPELTPYRFTGQEFDSELGLYNYRARFYDPDLGRFYSCDPKFQYGSPYAYCDNNAINRTDPSGEIASLLIILAVGALIGAGVGAAAATYTGIKSGLSGGQLAGYILAGAGIGAVAGALSSLAGVGAFAVGSAAAAATATAAGGVSAAIAGVAGVAAGAAVGATAGAAIGASQGVSQHFVNDLFGVENTSSWQQSLLTGAITGAVGGAIAGGIAGAGGAMATLQSLRYAEITGNNGWAFSPRSITQVSDAYSSFSSMGVVPLPSVVSRIPNVNVPVIGRLQTFVLSKFSLPTLGSGVKALAQKAITPLLPSSTTQNGNAMQASQSVANIYAQQAYNSSMSANIGLETALILNPSMWKDGQA
ncbi:RHS repeat domain-containing protein [Celerinatantimonas sp. YJH-8]|uniref:RHS repeat domain-containing protein n=1 Tax=Celerinatantimonas sp. YJH-8 TaxID=3228714 RepID=UPI0038C78163